MNPRCLVCGSTEVAPKHEQLGDVIRRSSQVFAFYQCRSCRSLTAHPIPSAEELASYYPEHYTFRANTDAAGVQRVWQRLLWWGYPRWTYVSDVKTTVKLTQCRRGRLLDIGCGTGIQLRLFQQAGFDIEGMDLSPEDCAYTRRTLGCAVHEGTLDTVTLAPQQFDLLTLFNTLEHLPAPRAAIQRIATLLKPGGWVAIKIPVADGWEPAVFGKWWRNIREIPRHLCLPSTAGLRGLLQEYGFNQVRMASASLMEQACMIGTTVYPWAIPYVNYASVRSPVLRAGNLLIGTALTYASLPLAWCEAVTGKPSTVVIVAQRDPAS